jgi:uridine phosphorylase
MHDAWLDPDDKTPPTIAATRLLEMEPGAATPTADSKTVAVTFHTRSALRYLERSGLFQPLARLPRFLGSTQLGYPAGHPNVWLLEGGFGAPAAADTLEVLAACGLRRLLMIGLCGGLAVQARVGDVILPTAVLREEGLSYHYIAARRDVSPETRLETGLEAHLRQSGLAFLDGRTVSTDAPYRQTLRKESLWRRKGIVGVDMETSAILAVGSFLGVAAAAVLVVSDVHDPAGVAPWAWQSTVFQPVLERVVDSVIDYAVRLSEA